MTPMKAITWIFRRRRLMAGPVTPRKRPRRSFASTFSTLEGRTLLAVVGPVASTVADLSASTATASTYFSTTMNAPPPSPGGGGPYLPPEQPAYPNDSQGSAQSGREGGPHPHDRYQNHVDLDVNQVMIDGQMTPEFALADAGTSRVYVRLGFGSDVPDVTLGIAQGINHPFAVKLADLNDDGIPDLIVANTGGNNVLVFPGLANGQFGPEMDGEQTHLNDSRPLSITVNDVGGNPLDAQLIVADRDSNSVSIINGQGQPGGWVATQVETIQTEKNPSKTVLYDINHDGTPDLLVCNSGSNSVTMYPGQADGTYAQIASATFEVGSNPTDLFVGQFDGHNHPDLITVNSGSDDLTFIGDPFGPRPTTRTISSGGVSPDAAFAIDPGHNGIMDLVVANSGDGHMALLQGSGDGMQLAGVITQSSLPVPTALAPSSWSDDEVAFFAVSAGTDAALLLHFDLGVASTFLPNSPEESTAIGQGDEELFSELMPSGESSMGLVAVFWAGSPDSEAVTGEWGLREPSTITSLYSPTEGQGNDSPKLTVEVSNELTPPTTGPEDPSKVVPSSWARFVLGIDAALDKPQGFVEAVAARDAPERSIDLPSDEFATLDLGRRPLMGDVEAASGAVDEALRMFWSSEGPSEDALRPHPDDSPTRSGPALELDGVDAPPIEVRLETAPLISSALLVSVRLIFKSMAPRPSTFRRKPGLRGFVSLENDPSADDRPDLV